MNSASAGSGVDDGSTLVAPPLRRAVTVPPVGAPSILLRGWALIVACSPGRIPFGPADGVAVSVTQRPDFHPATAASTICIMIIAPIS